MNSIGEEFISVLQIYLGEILLSKYDFHLFNTEIQLDLHLEDIIKEPIRKPNNHQIEWDIFLTEFETQDAKDINTHYTTIGVILFQILSEVSLLPRLEFNELFKSLFKKQSLATKTLSVNIYQYIYREIISKEDFDVQQRSSFNENMIINSNASKIPMDTRISSKYDQQKALDKITQRYTNCKKILSRSLPIYLESEKFQEYVNEKRANGYLDWEILYAITNKIVSLKVNYLIKLEENESEDSIVERMKAKHIEIMSQESEEDGICVPEDYIYEEDSEIQFGINTVGLLYSFGLESRAITPVTKGIRNLLNIKFNFKNDDKPEMSPFKF